ncbi:hypothetical protein C8R44DRAFT_876075 [Mycena epipterygia]|nr:hypothetical protein C8R44DRAFT_876075 [Mycena epipterygia]
MSSQSLPHSTPLKKPSSRVLNSGDAVTPPRSQEALKDVMKDEIGAHAWAFDPQRVSRILSPKTRKSNATDLGLLDSYDCLVDRTPFKDALQAAKEKLIVPVWPPTDNKERDHYPALVEFINHCVGVGNAALKTQKALGGWYQNLRFVVYDKETGDGVEGAHALKPDLVGLVGGGDDNKLYWTPTRQAATSDTAAGRGEDASPSRTFALVIGYNQTKRELRFLVFHRSGLTSSEPCNLSQPQGREDALRLMMTILLWSKPQHAGFISTSNEFEYLVPKSPNSVESIQAKVEEIIHASTCVRGRATRVCRLLCGIPLDLAALVSLKPTAEVNILRRSTRLQSPLVTGSNTKTPKASAGKITPIYPRSINAERKLEWCQHTLKAGKGDRTLDHKQEIVLKVSWQRDSRKDMEKDMYAAGDGRFGTPGVLCSYDGTHPTGEPISTHLLLPTLKEMEALKEKKVPEHVKTIHWTVFSSKAPSSAEALTQDILLGWHSFYQSGFMQRDISIGNVLLIEIEDEVLTMEWPPGELSAAFEGLKIQSEQSAESPAHQIAAEIKALVATLQIEQKCTAFVTDGDMAANWKTYFDNRHDLETRSGTVQFMSLGLQRAMETDRPYIHSPIDDLESFFWLAFWAVVFNKQNKTRSVDEVYWQQALKSGHYEAKTTAASRLKRYSTFSLISNELVPLLKSLDKTLDALRTDWDEKMEEVGEVPKTQLKEFYIYHFHLYSLLGVRDILSAVAKHYGKLKPCNAFPSQ